MDGEEQERKRKLEAGKAKLAQFRQRKGQSDSQNAAKKNKKKKTSSGSKQHDKSDLVSEAVLSQSDDAPSGAATTAEFTIMRTLPQGEMIQHDKTYTIEPESEVSTTADDYSSEEEEFGVRETFSERGTQSSQTRLEVMEDELAGKQQEIEELNRELEEMRAAYGNEGLQQLQEFETAIKQRDGIITQLTSNLQQARKEKDDIMREFLELTEQSQKLKIQFQHLQAGETLRNSSHTSTAADLLHTRQQILSYQQQLEERDQHLGRYQKEKEDLQAQVTSLQDQIHSLQQEQQRELESSYEQRLNEKDSVVDSLKSALHNEEIKCTELEERIYAAEKSVDELREELTQKSQEINSLSEELNTSKQRERRSSDEIKQLMGTVEDLQKKHHKDSQSEADLAQRMESETQRKLEQLQAELDEMYGQQIVQMKQELVRQHTLEIQRLLDQHKLELDNVSRQTSLNVTSERINELNAVISELNAKLQESDEHRKKMKEDLSKKLQIASSEKSHLQKQIEDLLQDLSFAREQIQKAKQSLTEKENQLNEANSFLTTIDDLKAELVAAKEFTKELESKHEAEVTNYKIKLEMLEREKDAVLDRMAESQEAELEKLRTYFLFSQEEELTKLREDLGQEHRTNIENLKDNLEIQYKKQIEQIQQDMNETITAIQSEKDSLITKQNNLVLEVSKLKDSPQCVYDSRSEEMMVQINELQKELECFRREEKEKGSIEQEVHVLQLRIEMLEKEVEDRDALKEKLIVLEADNRLLRDENDALQNTTKDCNTENCEKLTELAHLDLKNQIEVLSLENERLRDLELRLREEIEQQKNTFSFAEKNFEVNYHELKDEYTFLVKEKERLEDSKSKMEEDYRLRLQALGDDLAKPKGDTMGEPQVGAAKSIKVHRLDVGDVVEKDTTELMEKLEIAQRDKEELSLKLSSLSEELQLKQNEINQLKVELLVLGRDPDTIEDESCLKDQENVPIAANSHNLASSNAVDTCVLEESIRPIESPPLHVSPQVSHLQKELQDALMEKESLLQRVRELSGKLEAETSLVEIARLERDELQQKVEAAVQEQTDLMLQLEAQRISLTQIHKAHVELMGENFRSEREQELRSLRDSLLASEEQKIRELQELHQQERLSRPPPQQTVSDSETCRDLTGMLMKRIQEECDRINQALSERLTDEKATTPDAENMSNLTDSRLLEQHRAAVQTLHSNLDALLGRFLEEYKQMRELSSCMEKTGDRQATKEEIEIPAVTHIVIHSQNPAPSPSEAQEVLVSPISPSEEVERLKVEFSQQRAHLEDKHAQEIQHLRSYFQQQLKENEDRFSTEIIHLLEKLQDVTAGSPESREISRGESASELGCEEAAIFQSVVSPSTDVLKMDGAAQMGDHSLRQPFGPIYEQLQSLRQALYAKYVEEVNALKKRHEEELDQLRAELTAEHNKENAALNQQIIHLTKDKQEILNGSFQEAALYPIPEEKEPEDLNQLVEERFHEKIEEEVARVIVEMSIAFAQQTELARLAVLKDEEIAEPEESPGEQSGIPAEEEEEADLDGEKLRGVTSVEASLVTEDRDLSTVSPNTQETKDLTPEHHDGSQPDHPNTKEKTVVLKEEDYNQMVAMGAESAKYKQMFEEKVEDMRQELVRQEQEYQQAAEALRLAHTAQLERQMYDQEQLLLEVHRLRAQLAENATAVTAIQATDREKMLLEELESLKLSCAEVTAMSRACPLQDGSSQTQQDEDLPQTESNEEPRESEPGDEEGPADETGGDRKNLKRTNKQLLKILLEVVKTTGAVEETIGRHVMGLLDKSGRRQSTSKVHAWSAETEHHDAVSPAAITVTAGPDEMGVGVEGASIWSAAAVEELDVPLQLTEEGLSGTDLSPEDETQINNISIRLQAAVEKLLEAINDTSNQLAHAKVSQTELVRESIKRKQETTELLRCQEELQERLNEEAKVREHLALELSKAEGLLDGYTDERVFLEKQMQEKSELIRHLELELQSTGNRLQELEQERQQIQEEKELLSRQKLALKAEAAPAEQQLLEETEKLLKEKIEVQRQAEKDSGDLHKQVKLLELELEEQVNRYMEMEQEKNADLEDLRQKNLSLEKQLEKTRRFLDEQAVDREHERDVFQQEIQKLEQQLKMPQRHQPVADHQNNEVEKLESNLKEKTDKCSELLLCKEQLQRDVQERNEELEKLEGRIRELEQALIISTDGLQKAEDRRPSIVIGVKGEMPLEAQLQVERDATDRKEKEITNLVEQLEQFREELENKNEEVQQLHMQLEIQRKESDTRLQELKQENKVLKDEAISTEHEHPRAFSSSKVPQPKPGKNEELLLLKDQEIDLLNEQIGRLQAQLESATDNKVIEEKNEQIKEYKSQIKCLKSDQEQLKKNSEEEIEKLNEVIEKLQEELSHIEQKVAVDFADKHQYEDVADRKDILQPLVGHGEAPFTNMQEENVDASKPLVNNMAVECKNTYNTDMRNEISSKLMSEPEDVNVTLQNMESKLKELMDIIKKKDEQIVMLEKQNLLVKDVNEVDSNTAVEHGNISNTDRANEIHIVPSKPLSEPEDMQVTLQDMEAKLKELKDIIEEKNEQIVILQKQTLIMKGLEETVQRLQTELEERDEKSTEMQSSGHHLSPVGPEKPVLPPNTEESSADETLSDKEMVTKKVEMQQLEEVSGKSTSLENLVKKKGDDTANIERLSEELREKTAQHLAAEALLISAQEASKEAIHHLEIQLQDLRTAVHEKDSQILQLTSASPLPDDQEIERLNHVIRDLQEKLTYAEEKIKDAREGQRETFIENTEILLEKLDQDDSELASMKAELQKTRMEMGILEKELEKYKLLHETMNPNKESKTIETSIDGALVTDVEETLPTRVSETPGATQDMFTSTEETTITTIKDMESQIQELQNVIHLKDEELLKYADQKDLLDQQMKEIEQLNKRLQDSKKVKRDISDATRKDGENQESDGETITENLEVQKNSALEKELEETKKAMALLKENLEKVKDINTKDGVSQTYHQESLIENEENDDKVLPIIAKLEKTRIEMDLLEEKMANVKLFQGSENVKESDEGDKEGALKQSKSGKAAQSLENQIELTFTNTPKDMELHIQQLQNIISLKDAELMEWTNQKDLLKRQAQEIEQLKAELQEERKDSMDSGATTKDGESQTSHKTSTTENREVQKDFDGDNILQAELQASNMEVAALKEELGKLKESKQIEASSEEHVHKAKRDKRDTEEAEREKQAEPSKAIKTSTEEATQNVIHNMESRLQDVTIEEASREVKTNKSKLDKRDTEAAEREEQAGPSQNIETSTEETTKNVIHNMESRLQELQNVIQQKDSQLQQYLNQQNQVSQQTMEIERLQDEIETLKQKLEDAELMKSSIIKTAGGEQIRDKEKKARQLVNGETTVTNSHDTSVDVRQMLRGKDDIDGQDPSQDKSLGDETYDSGVDGTLRERTARGLANQVLLTSVQETMQNTIDTMESQLLEMQQVIKEKDLEILLYLEEIETLKEQVKAESDQHGQVMGALEDTLREKVAAALVSDAQLKAIQVHTKELHDDDRPFMLEEEEARTLQDLGAKPSAEEGAESKLSSLSLRLLELEKQLSDLHEQLQVERQQVHIANEKAAEKERQLCELQKILESSWGNRDINWVKSEADTAQSQRIVIQSEDNTAPDLENVLQSVKAEATATKEELCHYREVADKQKEELMVKESNLAHLEEDLREVRKCLAHAEEKLAFYMKKELQEEEQQQTMSGVDFTDRPRSTGWSGKERSTSSSSQTDVVPSVNTSNQTARVHHKNIGVQKELESARLGNTSEEVAELMERYTDKISQMQELHAAEILDMEARHISEADALRREQYTVVQALTNECVALKAVIETLKSSGGVVPDAALSPSYHLTDAASSECDWSQGTYDAQSLDQLPEGLRVEDDVPAELISSKIKDLLQAVQQEGMQVLSLTEATSPEKEKTFTLNTQSWREERKTLLEAIASLKDLIAKMQLYKEPEIHTRADFHERTPDWRGELLRAIQEVFCREQDALLSAYHTQLSTLGNCDPTALLNQMQQQLQEQGIEQINSMDCIQNAERRSLLLEIQDLRAKLTSLQIDRNIDPLHHTEGTSLYLPQDQSSRLQDQSSLLQDQSSLPQEMHLQLHSMKASAGELQDQLSSERLLSEEIKNELALTKMELESTVKLQHKHFKELESLRMELKKRREELDSANDALANEQKKTRELQWSLEKEKTRAERDEQHEKEELEDLQILLEEQKTKTLEISKRLEEEQLLVKSLQEQLASKESLHDSALSVERSRVSELQAFLDAEKTRSGELANTLERRRGLADSIENTDGAGQQEGHNQAEELLRDLQGQLDTKHHRIVELVSEAEGYKLECVQLRQSLDEERQRLRKELETEKETASLAKKQAEELRSAVEELQKQIQDKVKEIRRLQTEEKRLKETIQSLQNSGRTKESGAEKAELPESPATSTTSMDPARSEPYQPTGSTPNVLCPDPLSLVDGDPDADGAMFSVDTIRRKLLQVSSKLRHLAAKTTRRVMFDATDDDDFAWSQNAVLEVMSQLEHLTVLSLQGQNLVLPSGISANTLTEKLLTQNAELTGYVSRLTNEKNDLQKTLLRLEGEISHHRAREGSGDHSPQSSWDHTTTLDSLTEEREAWNREKLSLHKSLSQMEAELSKVKAELRNESIQRDIGRDTDNAALKRVYGKYLRSESFRKALVYQKKYLLLLLGGFQECEEATLALIARMGGQPSFTDLEVITKHSRAFTRFRSAARVAIAISRMRFLVRRWQRAISPGAADRNGFGLNIGNEVRTDSPYHPAGSVDLYGDQRLSCRSRSGFDSPQSTVNSQHRYASSDLSSSSHLQNYDPDRALTDYIVRLEALQKRLGNAPSGSNTNSTAHYSIRR